MTKPVHEAAQSGFTDGAANYVRGRPEYPEALQAWLCGQLGLGPGTFVIEPGAGTGKSGISLSTVGLILMIVGAAGIVLSLLYMVTSSPRRRTGPERERVIEHDPNVY